MSKEMAAAFVDKVNSDYVLRHKLVKLGTNPKIDAILDLAASYGFYFNRKDLVEALKLNTGFRVIQPTQNYRKSS